MREKFSWNISFCILRNKWTSKRAIIGDFLVIQTSYHQNHRLNINQQGLSRHNSTSLPSEIDTFFEPEKPKVPKSSIRCNSSGNWNYNSSKTTNLIFPWMSELTAKFLLGVMYFISDTSD